MSISTYIYTIETYLENIEEYGKYGVLDIHRNILKVFRKI